ncbi:MAG TPA: hypothetical protein DCQ98_02410, partial [Planctomycetaceae bacterium]|nr:hypothetical protein [Planctomycetaceae bacterium]
GWEDTGRTRVIASIRYGAGGSSDDSGAAGIAGAGGGSGEVGRSGSDFGTSIPSPAGRSMAPSGNEALRGIIAPKRSSSPGSSEVFPE